MTPRDIQWLLTAAGYYNGGLDGDFGPKSELAVTRLLEKNQPAALKWSASRQMIAAAQVVLDAAGYEPGNIDGYAGHNTKEAFNAWAYYQVHGKREILPGRDEPTLPFSPAIPAQRPPYKWPKQSGLVAFYGEPGSAAATSGTVTLPMPFSLAWNLSQKIKTFKCHGKVAASFTSIYGEAVKHYGEKQFSKHGLDKFGGCYNFRKMRGGTSYSTHAYGIAADHDPENNQLRWGRDRATFATSAFDAFWRIVEAHGATSLGRARNYDWMHFQFASL